MAKKSFFKIYIFIALLILLRAIGFYFFQADDFFAKNNRQKSDEISLALFEKDERFHPVIGTKGVVSVQEKLATKIGLDVLEKGGNAVDAAVAIGYALGVTLPRAGNIGGGGFMLFWDNKNKKAYNINYRETSPSKISPEDFLNSDNQVDVKKLADSFQASGVPGTVYGLNLAKEKFGSPNITLKQLLEPSIELAENGFALSYASADALFYAKDRLGADEYTKNIFFKNDSILGAGHILKQKDLANTLKRIALNGTREFYQGKTAELLVKSMKKNNGSITLEDLKNYKAEITEPIKSTYRGYQIISSPLPSSGGITIIEILNILENLDFEKIGNNSAKYIHYLVEAMNYSFYDRNYNLGDPKFIKDINSIVNKIISKNHAKEIFNKINPSKHTPSKNIDDKLRVLKEGNNTTHYVVIDKDGNMVSNTYSLNYSFGIAKAVKGAGFLLNNVMDDFTIKANTPNAYGLIQDEENLVGPNKQPLSSMAPTIILNEEGHPVLATGSPGGSRIITTVLQVILNFIDYNYNIATAVANPRVHSQLWPDKVLFEEGISQDTLELLKRMGHTLEKFRAMGSAQSASVDSYSDKLTFLRATADPRREGAEALGLQSIVKPN